MTVIWRSGLRANRKAAVAPAMPQPMIKTSVSANAIMLSERYVFCGLEVTNFRSRACSHACQALHSSPDRDHSFHGPSGANADFFRDLDHVLNLLQRLERVFQSDLVHVRTSYAA